MVMTQEEVKELLIAMASEDGEFRARLVADPKAAVEQLNGRSLPDAFKVQVHHQSATTFHLVLPPDSRLTEEELALVFGGIDWACPNTCGHAYHP